MGPRLRARSPRGHWSQRLLRRECHTDDVAGLAGFFVVDQADRAVLAHLGVPATASSVWSSYGEFESEESFFHVV